MNCLRCGKPIQHGQGVPVNKVGRNWQGFHHSCVPVANHSAYNESTPNHG